jgi:hypothetical protein
MPRGPKGEKRPADVIGAAVMIGKIAVARDVLADRANMEKCIGPKLGKRFVSNPAIAKYDFVLRFPTAGVVTGRAMARALKNLSEPRGATLAAGYDFTMEARQMAAAQLCDLVSMIEFGWTDVAPLGHCVTEFQTDALPRVR